MRTIALLILLFSMQGFAQTPVIQEDLSQWYSKKTGHSVDETFGIARIEKYNDELIIGMARKQQGPVDQDGAMAASFHLKNRQIEKLGYLFEQGLTDMEIIDGILHIPGTDPRFRPDSDPVGESPQPFFYWNLGNWYRFDLTKSPRKRELIRNLPLVVHGWGQWYDKKNKTIYHATSRVTCPVPSVNGDCYQQPEARGGGSLFKSTDFGLNWVLVADRDEGIGYFRTYDVQGTENALFVVWGDRKVEGTQDCGVARQLNGSSLWERVAQLRIPCKTRLQSFKGTLIAVDELGRSGILVSDSRKITIPFDGTNFDQKPYASFKLPVAINSSRLIGFKISESGDRLYFASRDGIYSTSDTEVWTLHLESKGLEDIRDFVVDESSRKIYVAERNQIYEVNMDATETCTYDNNLGWQCNP